MESLLRSTSSCLDCLFFTYACVSLCECVVWVVVFFSPVLKFQTFIELFAFLLNFAHTLCSFSFPFFSLISFFFLNFVFVIFAFSYAFYS